MNRRIVLFSICTLGIIYMCFGVNAPNCSAESKKINGVTYIYSEMDEQSVWITRINLPDSIKSPVLKIPSQIGGKSVVKLGNLRDNKRDDSDSVFNLFGICRNWEEGNGELEPRSITKILEKIEKIMIPETVKSISSRCFRFMPSGKVICIPGKLKKNVEQLCEESWKKVTISSQNTKYKVKKSFLLSKSGKKVYGYLGQETDLKIPAGVKRISKTAFGEHTTANNIMIPKTVDKIEGGAFRYTKISEVKVAKNNKHYASKNNCIYSKKSGRLVLGISKKGIINMPFGVKQIGETTSFSNGVVKKIVFPRKFKAIKLYWLSEINTENDLSITFLDKIPPVLKGKGTHFPLMSKIYVPKGAKKAYLKRFEKEILDLDKMIYE